MGNENTKRFALGVDVGGQSVKIGVVDKAGNIIEEKKVLTDTSDGGVNIIPDIGDAIEGMVNRPSQALSLAGFDISTIAGCGLALPGPVNKNGIVTEAVNLGWGAKDASGELYFLTNIPTVSCNDANAAALGESWKGSGSEAASLVMITLGTGVGGGIICEGRIISGRDGAAGEIGHICVEPEEPEACACGSHGCLEQYCATRGVLRLAAEELERSPSSLSGIRDLTVKDVFDACKAGDAAAAAIAERFGRYLGIGAANICNTLNPDLLLLGGGISNAGQMIIEAMEPSFRQHLFPACKDTPVALASLGNKAGMIGAAKLAFDIF